MSLPLNWALKATINSQTNKDFSNRTSLVVQYDQTLEVPSKGSVSITFASGWTESVRFFAMDGGEESADFTWAFDDGNPRVFDEVLIVTGSAACQSLLAARKAIKFANTGSSARFARLLIGMSAPGKNTTAAADPSYVVPIIRIEVYPEPEFVFEPAIAYYLQPAAAVKTTLPNNGCLSVPVTKIQPGFAFGAFVVSASRYAEGLEYSLDDGTNWQLLSQSVVAFGIDACAYLPAALKSVELRNKSGEDVIVAVVVADWVPPFASTPERRG
jgi:hypothetical protein